MIALRTRRSAKRFETSAKVAFTALSRILNESVGVTQRFGRGTPSPNGANPLDCYVVALSIDRIQPGVYRYDPVRHGMHTVRYAPNPARLLAGSRIQSPVAVTEAFHVFVVADLTRAREAFGRSAERFVMLEAGHLVQSMQLLAVNEGLATCPIGHFDANAVELSLQLDPQRNSAVHSVAFGIPCRPS